ncbi:unnamed protein product (macronuclear) [Paramecium tetraurelia]|uniref:Uncharacterized protein n=1 Tax=Paramecium tetraurelia TaxID=5888 RepID=A0BCM1_PARTE|nr:uncharacterized protein GSPATT00004382001 [Paramecium tetraurelia]CAK56288.1 unnamed protein product [Paramecium tetraurelia]|eukprot:XP_001423686.1 hypothetical protein (macronuclear) [Paramecium tetraurelia strain d4-2]
MSRVLPVICSSFCVSPKNVLKSQRDYSYSYLGDNCAYATSDIEQKGSVRQEQPRTQIKTQVIVKEADHTFCEQRIAEQQKEIDLWRKKYLELQAELDRNTSYEETIQQLQDRVEILIGENKKLNQSLKQKIGDLDQARISINELEQHIRTQKNQNEEIQRLQKQLDQSKKQVNEWKNRFVTIEKQISTITNTDMKTSELEQKISKLQQDLSNWKERCLRAEKEKKDLEDCKQ